MSNRMVCDRCGRAFDAPENAPWYRVAAERTTKLIIFGRRIEKGMERSTIDLCNRCSAALEAFMLQETGWRTEDRNENSGLREEE